MTDASTRVYSGSSGTERVERRRSALVTAAFELIAEDGWRALRVDRLAQRAGLSKRYVYESFPDLDAVTAAVIDRLGDGVVAALSSVDPELPITEFVHASLSALVHHVTDDPRGARVLFDEVSASPAASRYRELLVQQLARLIAARARQVHHRPHGGDPIIELAASFVLGGTIRTLLDWTDGRIPMNQSQLIDDLTSLWRSIGDGATTNEKARNAVRPGQHPGSQPSLLAQGSERRRQP